MVSIMPLIHVNNYSKIVLIIKVDKILSSVNYQDSIVYATNRQYSCFYDYTGHDIT